VTSNKMTYMVAGTVIGGAVGYFLLTDSGRRTVRSVREFDPNRIPEKLDEFRAAVERGGRDISKRVETARHRILESFESGRIAYNEVGTPFESQLRQWESRGNEVVGGIHRAIDELNKTVYTFEKSVLGPAYEIGSLVRAIKRGWNSLTSSPAPIAEAPKFTGMR